MCKKVLEETQAGTVVGEEITSLMDIKLDEYLSSVYDRESDKLHLPPEICPGETMTEFISSTNEKRQQFKTQQNLPPTRRKSEEVGSLQQIVGRPVS